MTDNGWVKLHRQIINNPIVMKDSDHLAVWVFILITATHKPYHTHHHGRQITLKPGQLITGRLKIATALKINESKVQRILLAFENEQQIEQLTTTTSRLITVVNWHTYQQNGQPDEQPIQSEQPPLLNVNNERTTNEQPDEHPENPINDCIERNYNRLKGNVEQPDEQPIQKKRTTNEQQNDTKQEIKNKRIKNKDIYTSEEFHPLLEWVKSNTPRVNQLKQPLTVEQCISILQVHNEMIVKDTLLSMENYKKLLSNYTSAFLTLKNWLKRNNSNGQGNSTNRRKPNYVSPEEYATERENLFN